MTAEPTMSSSGLFPSRPLWPLTLLALVCLIVSGGTLGADGHSSKLPSQVTTANPLSNESPAMPNSVLEGDKLTLRQKGSLGGTLGGLPGVSSTYFGSGASRSVIRGMDGDRIRLLRSGVGMPDASSLSYDHTVPGDPNSVGRLEMARGPVTLLYGGNATSGVVNSFDDRILSEPADDIHSSGGPRHGGTDTTRSRSGVPEAGDDNFTLHAGAASREFSDVRIPGYAYSNRQRQIDGDAGKHRVQNSDGRQDGGAVGGPYHWECGYTDLSYSDYDSNYDSPTEDDAHLKIQQDRYAFTFEIRDLEDPFTSLKLDAAYTKYKHKEIEDGETGTTFRNEDYEGHIETRHCPFDPLNGVIDTWFANSRFSALGEKVFVSYTGTDSAALFALEEWKLSDRLDLSFGAHLEYACVDPDAKGDGRFVRNDGSQSLTTGSLSTDAVYKPTLIWLLAATLGYTEHAPTFYELYTSGPRAVTGTYEAGDADADKERTVPTDLVLRFNSGVHKGNVRVFYSRFSNYIGLLASGHHCSEEGEMIAAGGDEALPKHLYSGVCADFYGAEVQDRIYLLESPRGNFNLELSGDYTRAKNRDTGEPLPRTTPLRLNTALIWELQQRQARIDAEHAVSQYRVPEEELPVDDYITLGASLSYNFDFGESHRLVFVKGTNLISQTVRYAGSILRDRVPAAGRGVETGARVTL